MKSADASQRDGRRAALNATLPLLASYFADAATWNLEVSSQLGTLKRTEIEIQSSTTSLRVHVFEPRWLLPIGSFRSLTKSRHNPPFDTRKSAPNQSAPSAVG